MPAQILPVDEILPARKLILLGLQHVLVMAASPITSVFLVSKALNFSPALTVNLISATFLVCGLGTLLQSFGPLKFGARLPFIMVPGGAPVVIFLTTAQQTDIQTAVGAVMLTGLFYFLVLPVFRALPQIFSETRDRHHAAAGGDQPGEGLWRHHHRRAEFADFRGSLECAAGAGDSWISRCCSRGC